MGIQARWFVERLELDLKEEAAPVLSGQRAGTNGSGGCFSMQFCLNRLPSAWNAVGRLWDGRGAR